MRTLLTEECRKELREEVNKLKNVDDCMSKEFVVILLDEIDILIEENKKLTEELSRSTQKHYGVY